MGFVLFGLLVLFVAFNPTRVFSIGTVLWLGLCAYLIKRGVSATEKDDAASLLRKAIKLEAQYKLREAVALYDEISARFPGQSAAHDAEISAQQIRTKMGST